MAEKMEEEEMDIDGKVEVEVGSNAALERGVVTSNSDVSLRFAASTAPYRPAVARRASWRVRQDVYVT